MYRKALKLGSAACAALVAVSGVAAAESYLVWDVDKIRVIDTDIVVVKHKNAFVQVFFEERLTGAAQAHAFGNAVTAYNRVSFFGDDDEFGSPALTGPDGIFGTDDDGDLSGPDGILGTEDDLVEPPQASAMGLNREALVENSFNTNSGIVQANQDSGNMANQGNYASIALVNNDITAGELPTNPETGAPVATVGTFAHAEAYSDEVNFGNQIYHVEDTPFLGDTVDTVAEALELSVEEIFDEIPGNLVSDIGNSFTGNTGVMHFNQNSGNMNNQHNALATAIGDDVLYALADAGIAQVTAFNHTEDANTVKYDRITSSFNENSGVLNVNQASGAMNNQSTVVSVAALTSVAGIGLTPSN